MRNSSNQNLVAVVLAFALSISGCSRSPEADTPGQCPLDCSSAVIANSTYRASPLVTISGYTCANMTAGQVRVLDPVLLMFKVEGEVADTTTPRRAISIQPVVMGGMDAAASEKAGNVTKLPDGTYEPTRYIGIATPKEEWCTDACGVFSVEVTPVCALGFDNPVTVMPTSGAMATEGSTFTVNSTAPPTTLQISAGEGSDELKNKK